MLGDAKNLSRFLLVKYEELTEDTRNTLNKIFRFIGVEELEINALESIERQNITGKPLPIKNLNELSLANLFLEDINAISKIAWPLAARLGYNIYNAES